MQYSVFNLFLKELYDLFLYLEIQLEKENKNTNKKPTKTFRRLPKKPVLMKRDSALFSMVYAFNSAVKTF